MKKDLISPNRRTLIKAGAAGGCTAMAPSIASAAATQQNAGAISRSQQLPLVLSGRIVDEQDRPVAGARIAAANFFERVDGALAFTAVSDADGRFVVEGHLNYDQGDARPMRLWIRSDGRSAAFESLVFDDKPRQYENTRMNVVVDRKAVSSSVSIRLA